MSCVASADCAISTPPDKTPFPLLSRPHLVANCKGKAVAYGEVDALFRSAGKSGLTRVKKDGNFKTALSAYAGIDCLVGDQSDKCTGTGTVKTAMGKGFNAESPWQAVGDPCGLGLPCGKVGLPTGPFVLRLTDASARGRLRLLAPGLDQTAAASGAEFSVPAGALKAGQSYQYQFIGEDGNVRAAGKFTVLSQRAQQDADTPLNEAMNQPADTRPQAVIEALLLYGREWEALQSTLGVMK